ncbi:phi PVL orf 3-like protein [Staphylococcus aureus]|nr:phi PVL orf 3-like protein [Staphylococcus aureus]
MKAKNSDFKGGDKMDLNKIIIYILKDIDYFV